MKMDKSTSTTSMILSVVALLADTVSLAKLSYDVIILNNTTNIIIRFVVIVLVFFLGLGLGSIGLRGEEQNKIQKILQIYMWAYLLMACLTYIGVISQFRYPYSFANYVSFIVIIVAQLAAFIILLKASAMKIRSTFSLALITISLIHALIILFAYVYLRMIPDLQYVIGEILFWLAWTVFAAVLLYQSQTGEKLRSHLR